MERSTVTRVVPAAGGSVGILRAAGPAEAQPTRMNNNRSDNDDLRIPHIPRIEIRPINENYRKDITVHFHILRIFHHRIDLSFDLLVLG